MHDGVDYVFAEQWMMAAKARLMGDRKTLEKILSQHDNPTGVKRLGRQVRPWKQELWDAEKYNVVLEGTRLKVSQNPRVRKILMATGGSVIAEASPSDRVWGIGLNKKDAEAGMAWRGDNLLGRALMQVREEIRSGKLKV